MDWGDPWGRSAALARPESTDVMDPPPPSFGGESLRCGCGPQSIRTSLSAGMQFDWLLLLRMDLVYPDPLPSLRTLNRTVLYVPRCQVCTAVLTCPLCMSTLGPH